jgi:hypothetical protein
VRLLAIFAFLPLLLGASLPVGTEDPAYGCDLVKGYCVVRLDEFQELVNSRKPRCTELDT